MRAKEIAAAHMAHGSSVTYRSQSVSRSEPSTAAAARIAKSSAWAVGSRSRRVRLPARAITSAPRTIAQPTGTSWASPAARASAKAMSMKEGCGTRSFRPKNFAIRHDLSMKEAMPRKSDQDETEHGERIAKAIARAGLASRREAEAWIAAGRVALND